MKGWCPMHEPSVGFFQSVFHAVDQVWWPPARNWGVFLILPQSIQMPCKDHWKLQQPGFQWTLGRTGVISEMTSGMGGSASASMSTQVYRARGNSSTRDHLKLALTDASPHHRPTYGCREGQASARGGWSHVKQSSYSQKNELLSENASVFVGC